MSFQKRYAAIAVIAVQLVFVSGMAMNLATAQEVDSQVDVSNTNVNDTNVSDVNVTDTSVSVSDDSVSAQDDSNVSTSQVGTFDVSGSDSDVSDDSVNAGSEVSTESSVEATQEVLGSTTEEVIATPVTSPTLSTDKEDYYPGETASIFGRFFGALQNILLSIFGVNEDGSDFTGPTQTVTADENGSFTTSYTLENVFRPLYTVVARDNDSQDILTQISFTDAADPAISYDKGVYRTDQNKWTTGQAGDAYEEGDFAFYTYAINGIGGADVIPSFNIIFNHYQNSSDAIFIDSFTNLRYCWNCDALPDGTSNPPVDSLTTWKQWTPANINNEYNDSTHVCGSIDSEGNGPAQFHCIKVLPGQFTGQPAGNDNTLRIFFEAHLARTVDWATGNEANMEPEESHEIFSPAEANPAGVFGEEVYAAWTQSRAGMGSATGSSRHFDLADQSAGPNGAITLPIPTVAAPSATLTIIKDAQPNNNAQDFSFNAGALGTFSLDDDSDNVLSNTKVFTTLAAGTYSVSEGATVGWTNQSATCSDGSPVNAIVLSDGENVTCTFVNTPATGHIIVDKVTVGGDSTFDFTTTGAGYTGFSLSNGGSNNQEVVAGAYTVAETAKTGWSSDGGVCNSGETPASLDVEAGETVTCTFTNTKLGKILVDKITVPGASIQSFEFNPSWSASNFNLTDADSPADSGFLTPGSYDVSETALAGWDLTSATCDDQSPIGAISLQAGETVKCTFTNTQRGHIIVDKVTVGGDATFAFDANGGSAPAYTDFNLSGADTPNNQTLKPGAYSVSEADLAGWDKTSATCDGNGNTPASITLAAGQTVTCTFTNTKKGHITIEKQTLPNDSNAEFIFTGDVADTLSDGETKTEEVSAGVYHSTEGALAGWDLTSIVCSDGDSSGVIGTGIATFNVAAGEDVKCTFTNTQRGHIIVNKVTVGGNASFEFDSDYGVNFLLQNGQNNDSGFLVAGTYSVDEINIPAGWIKYSSICDDGSLISAIHLGAGETVTCTFTNKKPGAQIDLSPLTAANKVGDNHIITATVKTHNGDGVYHNAPDATVVTFSITNSNGATAVFVPVAPNTCATLAGVCTITINSPTTGTVSVHASSDPVELGVAVHVESNGAGDNSVNAGKTYVNAKIAISPDATNKVGDPHTFTVTVLEDAGNGAGFVAAAGEHVNFSLTNSNGANAVLNAAASTCDDAGPNTNGSGQCTIVFSSATAGKITGHASATVSVGGINVPVQTNGGINSSDAIKTYVNAKISITPVTATNEVGDAHNFVVTVMTDDGSGLGFSPLLGALVDVSVTPVPDGGLIETDCNDGTDAAGQCTATINSSVAGIFTTRARSQVTVGGVIFQLQTNGNAGNSAPATKTYVDARITLSPLDATNQVGQAHTVTVTVEKNLGSGWVAAPNEDVDFTLTPVGATPVLDAGTSTCDNAGPNTNGSGQCTIVFSSATPGTVTIHAKVDVTINSVLMHRESGDGISGDSVDANKKYEGGKIIVKKITVGGDGQFTFDTDYTSDFQLGNNGENNSGFIPTGNHSVAEVNIPAGWDLTSAVCDDQSNPASIGLSNGETVTCTFTNTKLAKLTVVKDASPNDCADFAFTLTGKPGFSLDDDAGVADCADNTLDTLKSFPNLSIGNYTIGETEPNSFWTLGSASCVVTGEATPYTSNLVGTSLSLNLTAGADVTCTFVNNKLSPSRTLGFWQTHTAYTTAKFNANPLFIGQNVSVVPGTTHKGILTSPAQVFGGFFAPIPKTTTGSARNPVDKARIQLLQQLLAAKLNCATFGCSATIAGQISNADSAYLSGTAAQILAAAAQMDAYNNSGDTLTIGNAGSATPKASKDIADLVSWNLP